MSNDDPIPNWDAPMTSGEIVRFVVLVVALFTIAWAAC